MQRSSFFTLLILGMLAIGVGGCGGVRYMVKTDQALQPSANTAVITFIRPSGMGGDQEYAVFTTDLVMAGNLGRKSRFELTVPAGTHTYIGQGGEIASVITIEAQAGKHYDVVTHIAPGFWLGRLWFDPIEVGDPNREKLPKWFKKTKLYQLDASEKVVAKRQRLEAKWQERNNEALQDFTQGDKRDRLKSMTANDYRNQ